MTERDLLSIQAKAYADAASPPTGNSEEKIWIVIKIKRDIISQRHKAAKGIK
jgi:hypothetical protein